MGQVNLCSWQVAWETPFWPGQAPGTQAQASSWEREAEAQTPKGLARGPQPEGQLHHVNPGFPGVSVLFHTWAKALEGSRRKAARLPTIGRAPVHRALPCVQLRAGT